MARYAHTPVPDMLEWTASDAGFLLLLIATLLEVLGDKIPLVDHALDTVATFLKPAAGLILPVALLVFTVLAPILAVGLIVLLGVVVVRAWRRMRRKPVPT